MLRAVGTRPGPSSWKSGLREMTNAILNIDLGEISEDINADGLLQTEDRPSNGQRGNGVLEDDEDTGLDGVFEDSQEEGKNVRLRQWG